LRVRTGAQGPRKAADAVKPRSTRAPVLYQRSLAALGHVAPRGSAALSHEARVIEDLDSARDRATHEEVASRLSESMNSGFVLAREFRADTRGHQEESSRCCEPFLPSLSQ
jgi:hypothetical protein